MYTVYGKRSPVVFVCNLGGTGFITVRLAVTVVVRGGIADTSSSIYDYVTTKGNDNGKIRTLVCFYLFSS